jgi:molybdopterin converting factor small subunit
MRYFAQAKEATGNKDTEEIQLQSTIDDSSVERLTLEYLLQQILYKKYPELERVVEYSIITINMEQQLKYINVKLKDGMEVAILPPFSGG